MFYIRKENKRIRESITHTGQFCNNTNNTPTERNFFAEARERALLLLLYVVLYVVLVVVNVAAN